MLPRAPFLGEEPVAQIDPNLHGRAVILLVDEAYIHFSDATPSLDLVKADKDLIVLRTLQSMGPQHAYAIATRLQQLSGDLLHLNQGTLYPALVRLEQYGWIKGTWGKTENNREAKYYQITKAGQKALGAETQKWRTMSALVERLLIEES